MNSQPDSEQPQQLHTGGGAAITGDVHTGGGDFVGRDLIQHIREHVSITGDGNIVGDSNTVIHQEGDRYDIQIGEQHFSITVQDLRRMLNVSHSQIGVLGDHAHIEGGIHFHTTPPANLRERRNRAAMLQLVRNTWIKGLLEQSLHGAALIELGLEYRPDAVDHPWDMVVQMPERPDRQLPPGTRIVDVFDESGSSLLILGEPGSGKTTMLLELARGLIARAEQDETLHIPVVFNLSSWAVKQASLEEWLIEELHTKYLVPKRDAQVWVKEDTLLLLLDGLDEVKTDARNKCVAAINAFRQGHLMPLAICSRTADYELLVDRLCLQNAVCLQPLTSEQISDYLTHSQLEVVRAMIQENADLQGMAHSPLLLSMMALAYRDLSPTDLCSLKTNAASYKLHLFDTYLQKMFRRRGKPIYHQEQTLAWLAWLADKLNEHDQTVFRLEQIQFDWLPFQEIRWVRGLAIAIGVLLCTGIGIFSGILSAWSSWWRLDWIMGGLILGLVAGAGLMKEQITPVEVLAWSWSSARQNFCATLREQLALVLQSTIGTGMLITMLIGVWGAGLKMGLIAGIIVGLIVGLVIFLLQGLFYAIKGGLHTATISEKTLPNQGIQQSFKNAVRVGLLASFLFALGCLLFSMPFIRLEMVFLASHRVLLIETIRMLVKIGTSGLFLGLFLGLFMGVWYGGGATIQHYVLRGWLTLTGRIPWHYVHFLDACADRAMLCSVGGGYIFIYRLLQEHLANLALGYSFTTFKSPLALFASFPRRWQLILLTMVIMVGLIWGGLIWIVGRDVVANGYMYMGFQEYCAEKSDHMTYYLTRATELAPRNPTTWSELCWEGTIMGKAAEVLPACEQAVVLAPQNGGFRFIRGLARALIGDTIGADVDFEFYYQWGQRLENSFFEDPAGLRANWVTEFTGGQNHFDADLLEALHFEECGK